MTQSPTDETVEAVALCPHGIRHPHPCDECLDRDIPAGKRLADHPCYGLSTIRPTEFSHRNSWPLSSIEHPYCSRCGTEIEGLNNRQKVGAPLSWEPLPVPDRRASASIPASPPSPAGDVERLREHIAEQITHVETRIQDGREMGATVWRIALEDIARENRALLAALQPSPSPLIEPSEQLIGEANGLVSDGDYRMAYFKLSEAIGKMRSEAADALRPASAPETPDARSMSASNDHAGLIEELDNCPKHDLYRYRRVISSDLHERLMDALQALSGASAREVEDDNKLCARHLDTLTSWLLHRFGPDSPEGREASFRQTIARNALTEGEGS